MRKKNKTAASEASGCSCKCCRVDEREAAAPADSLQFGSSRRARERLHRGAGKRSRMGGLAPSTGPPRVHCCNSGGSRVARKSGVREAEPSGTRTCPVVSSVRGGLLAPPPLFPRPSGSAVFCFCRLRRQRANAARITDSIEEGTRPCMSACKRQRRERGGTWTPRRSRLCTLDNYSGNKQTKRKKKACFMLV